jgi:hypothetical protein
MMQETYFILSPYVLWPTASTDTGKGAIRRMTRILSIFPTLRFSHVTMNGRMHTIARPSGHVNKHAGTPQTV